MKIISVRLDDETHEKFKKIARSNYMSMSRYVERFIDEQVKEYEQDKER